MRSDAAPPLDLTGVTPGTYGDSAHVAQVEIDANGRVQSAANVLIPGGSSPSSAGVAFALMGGFGEEGDSMVIPGPAGAAGSAGPTGPMGPAGLGLPGQDGEEGAEGMPVPGPLAIAPPTLNFAQTQTITVANTVVETTIIGTGVGSLTLPANFLLPGTSLLIRGLGYHSTTANPTLRIRVYYGSTLILDSGAISTANSTNDSWELVVGATVVTTGATGTINCDGIWVEAGAGANIFNMSNLAPVTINTTTANTINVTVQWGTASTSNTITCPYLTLSAQNPSAASVQAFVGPIGPAGSTGAVGPAGIGIPGQDGEDGQGSIFLLPGGSTTTFANPTATSGPTAVNGSSTSAMRADAAPAVQLGTTGQVGLLQVDGTSITVTSGGIISAVGATGGYTVPDVASFAQVNFGSSSTSQNPSTTGPILWNLANSASLNWRILDVTPPSPPYKLTALLKMGPAVVNSQTIGIYFYDGTKLLGFENLVQASLPGALRIQSCANINTDSSNSAVGTSLSFPSVTPTYMQLRNNGTTLFFDIGDTAGKNFVNVYSAAVGSFITPTKIGWGGVSVSAGSPLLYVSLLNWIVATNANLNP